jgi:hypothetical protein
MQPALAEYYSNSIRGVPDSNIRKIGEFDKYSNTIREYSYQNKYSYQNNSEAIPTINVIMVYFNITAVFILILLQHPLVLSYWPMVGV